MSLFENREPLGHWRYTSGRKSLGSEAQARWSDRRRRVSRTPVSACASLHGLSSRISLSAGVSKGEIVRSYSAERGSRCKINESETPWGRSWVNLVHAESFLCLKATITRTLNRRCLLVPRAKV